MLTETETYYVRIGFRVYVIKAETALHAIIKALELSERYRLVLNERYGDPGKIIAINTKRPERKINENHHTV